MDSMPKNVEVESTEILEDLIDDAILGLSFEIHRAAKLNILFIDESKEDQKKYEIVVEDGLDVFGQVLVKKQFECVCPNCGNNLVSRFVPHLEKCMGMGRNSSRLASKRIANNVKVESDIDNYDNDNDNDWNYNSDRKPVKKKKDKNSPRRSNKSKAKNGDSVTSEGTNFLASYEAMLIDERKVFLSQACGVVSEHTKKICTRSQRCPQHTDEQRRCIRNIVLGRNFTLDSTEDINVDIIESENHAQHLWDSVNSGNPSPSDSSSISKNSNSSVVKKKDKRARFREFAE